MKILSSIIFLCLSLLVQSEASLLLKTPEGDLRLRKRDKDWVSENCLKGTCLALQTPRSSLPLPAESSWAPHPAASFCLANGGSYLKAQYPNGDEDGICRFKDQSFILAWNYYYLHRSAK